MAKLGVLMFETLLIYMCLMNECSIEVCKTSIGASTQDWIKWRNNYYKVIMEKMPWLEARDTCAEMGGVMVTPKSENESRFLAQITPSSDGVHHFWINCNDLINEGTWECDGQTDIPYEAWSKSEPNNYGKLGEDCGAAYNGGISWVDIPCQVLKRAVCTRPVPILHL